MANPLIESCKKILEGAGCILLIDWPDQRVPRSLLKAGLTVYGFSPNHYSTARLESGGSQNAEGTNLVFTKINKPPDPIDIVYIYRPEEEHASLIINHVLPLHAKVIWLQPPLTSIKTRDLAKEYGITFIEGVDITEIV
jgi:predicted CoA-binding protein